MEFGLLFARFFLCGALAGPPAHNPQMKNKQTKPTLSAWATLNPINCWLSMLSRNWWMSCLLPPWLTASLWARWGGVDWFHSIVIHKLIDFISFHQINLFISFHFITQLTISFTRWAACLLSWLVAVRLAAAHNQPKNKTIGPAKTAIPRSIPKLIPLIFMGSLCPLNHLYHLIQPMLSLPFNHLYCIKY